jgi:hypothetical protein
VKKREDALTRPLFATANLRPEGEENRRIAEQQRSGGGEE